MFTLTGFADEISDELDVQLEVLERLDIHYLELRGVWGKNVLALDDAQVERVKNVLDRRGMRVSAIGSPIGKIGIDDPFEPHLEAFRRALELARVLETPYVRIFSFYVPEGEADRYRGPVMERMGALLDEARGHPVTLLHENERRIYGDIPRRCRDILETFESPQLRMTFDPANFVIDNVHPFTDAYDLLRDYIAYVHVKDATMDDKRIVPAGQGDGQVLELLKALQESGYDGFLSLEPHLAHAGGFSGYSGPELFGVAAAALRELMQEIQAG
ncbi:MAG: sugar phosphate isomerase/epimerase family protein [Anaerolineae bacterium]